MAYAEDGADEEAPQERNQDGADGGGRQQRQRRVSKRNGTLELKERRRRVKLCGHLRAANCRNARRFIDSMREDERSIPLAALPSDALRDGLTTFQDRLVERHPAQALCEEVGDPDVLRTRNPPWLSCRTERRRSCVS